MKLSKTDQNHVAREFVRWEHDGWRAITHTACVGPYPTRQAAKKAALLMRAAGN